MSKYIFTIIATLTVTAFTLPASVFAYTSPGKPAGYFNDFAKVITAGDAQLIESKLIDLNKSTGVEVAIVTIPSLGDETIDSYAVKLFQEWGIGASKDISAKTGALRDGGLLILIAPNDREARIEVGYGLEGTVTDLQAGNIVNKVMIPAFRNGDYAGGINGAIDAVSGIIKADPTVIARYSEPVSSSNSASNQNSDNGYFIIFFFVIFGLNILAGILGKTKSWWLGGVIGAVVGVIFGFIWGFFYTGIGAIIIFTILGLAFDYYVSKHPPKGGGKGGGVGGLWPIIFLGGGGGGSGGFGGGGGFGGFGGGMSGGGGASGRW